MIEGSSTATLNVGGLGVTRAPHGIVTSVRGSPATHFPAVSPASSGMGVARKAISCEPTELLLDGGHSGDGGVLGLK